MQKRTLYKYLPIERITYLDDSLLRFTQPKALNDSFECLPTFSSCIELMNNITGKSTQEKTFKDVSLSEVEDGYILNDFFNEFKFEFNGFGIFSLSRR